eukprot:Pompholyxophrys_punicea_v1_NODE_1160_length_893_cov_5.609467.p1 type:complete len:255 gc:universal NODE_1160_length_893_cov_5.609467:810-46(-)
MNVGYGGKQASLHASVVDEKCLGPDSKLKPGDTQFMNFQPNDPPPFYMLDAPPFDLINPVKPKKRARKKKSLPADEILVDNFIEGYIGKPKGKKQILWERGLWKNKMTGDNKNPELNMDVILGRCRDFLEEKTALQALFEDRGHILIMSPKCHPELAGLGIEYSWGKSKLEFRRRINDQVGANLHANIVKAMSIEVLPLGRVRKFARRTRDYRRVYVTDVTAQPEFEMIEKMRKTRKTHRNIVDIEKKFLISVT